MSAPTDPFDAPDPRDAGQPLDALHLPIQPIAPRPVFADDLRRRLAVALTASPQPGGPDMSPTETNTETNSGTPTGTSGIADTGAPSTAARGATAPLGLVPYLAVADARAAIRFYVEAFGAEPQGDLFVMPDGKVGHSELRIGESVLHLADPFPMPGVADPTMSGSTSVQFQLMVPDCDAAFAAAVAAGATVIGEPTDEPYGSRVARIADPFGHRWLLSEQTADLTSAEMAERFTADGIPIEIETFETLDLGDRRPEPT